MGMAVNHLPQIREECEVFHLSDKALREIMHRLHNDLVKGLGKDTHANAIVKCWITYIQDLPNGKERGKFLALDLGGTNFRVLIINLGENHFDMQSKIYAIPNHIMTGTGVALFDHIAECLANFMKEHDVYEERLALGFTFSFPLKQLGLTKGILQRWTKGFSCSGVVGEDVVQGLKDAIARRGDVQIDICAILNDTTGTLMSCAWKNHNCKIGLIVGTGSNACYVEKTENCELFDGPAGKPELLINTEWGAFGDDGALDFIRTEFDRDVDENSINPGKQIQEKMISGMYMGELVRLALVKYTKMGLLFGGRGSDLLFQKGSFYTKYVSEIESDKPGDYSSCMDVLEELVSAPIGSASLGSAVRVRITTPLGRAGARVGGGHVRRARGVRGGVAARGAPGGGGAGRAAQQDGRAARHRRHRRLRLPLPPALPRAHVRQDRRARAARPAVRPDAVGGRQRARRGAGGGRGVPRAGAGVGGAARRGCGGSARRSDADLFYFCISGPTRSAVRRILK